MPPPVESAAASSTDTAAVPIREWLLSTNPLLERYASGLEELGYEDTSVLDDASAEEISEAADEIRMKMGHRGLFVRAVKRLNALAVERQQC